MTGRGTGQCGHDGCENPCPRDEDFCCTGCEEACRREDEENAAAAFAARVAAERTAYPMYVADAVAGKLAPLDSHPSLRERIEALPRYERIVKYEHILQLNDDARGRGVLAEMVKLSDVLALFDPECLLCEAGHVPKEPCGEGRCTETSIVVDAPVPDELPRIRVGRAYPRTEFNEDAGVWVEWSNPWHGKIVAPPEGEYQAYSVLEPPEGGGRWSDTEDEPFGDMPF